MSGWPETTWDGLPVSREPPFGAAVHVWRRAGDDVEWLVLHRAKGSALPAKPTEPLHRRRKRAPSGPDYAGDWAWTPPTGARLPGETVEACARRELLEEAGLALEPAPTPCGSPDWAVFVAELEGEVAVELSAEHDAFVWLTAEHASSRCLPALVADAMRCVAAFVASAARKQD